MNRLLLQTIISGSLLAGFLVFSTVGCGGTEAEGELEGSLQDVYHTEFDSVRIRLYSSELSIEYLRSNGEIPIRATLKASVLDEAPGEFQMPKDARVTGQSGRTRVPDVTQGTFTLIEFEAMEGANVKGEFTAQFRAGDDTVVLDGRFEGPLEIVEDIFVPEIRETDAGDAGIDLTGDVTYLPAPEVDVQPPVCTTATEGTDCDPGEVCDEAADICVPDEPDPVCTVANQETDCDPGEVCDEAADICVPGEPDPLCTVANQEIDCDPGEVCDEAADMCVPDEPDLVCTVANQETDCDPGEVCDEAADMCVPDESDPVCTEATQETDCDPGEVCDEVANECVEEIVCTEANQETDCEVGEVCDEVANECVPE